MRPKAAWRTVSGVKICLLTGKILPSILILTGALQVKNRSDAFFSTISLNSGLVFITWAGRSAGTLISRTPALALEHLPFFFLDDLQRLAFRLRVLHLALALELDAQAQLVLRIGIAQRI